MTTERDNGIRQGDCRVVKQIDGDASEADLRLLVSTDGIDDEGDLVEQEWQIDGQVPFLFAHKGRTLPVGHIVDPQVMGVAQLPADVRRNLSEDAERATVVGVDFDTEDEFAAAVLRKYQRGDMEDSSVGFDPIEFEEGGTDDPYRFRFMQSRLKEVSATPIGANSDTTVLSKAFDPDVIPDALRDAEGDDPTDKADAPDQTKEGRRNSKMDEAAQRHAKEMLEFMMGERDADDISPCAVCKFGDHDDKGGGDEKFAEVLAAKIADEIEERGIEVKGLGVSVSDGEAGDEQDDTGAESGGESEGPDDGDAFTIDGERIIDLEQEKSEEPDSSSGEAWDGDTSEGFEIDELFAQ